MKVVLDTNVLVGWIRAGLHADLVLGREHERYLSTVVLMELRLGARSRPGRRSVDRLRDAFESAQRVVTPTLPLFDQAGAVLRALQRSGREIRRASLVNDVLIALSARSIGATLFTRDAGDFEAIRTIRSFQLGVVAS